MTENTERLTQQEEAMSEKIADIVSRLSEEDQAKIYYMIKGIELAGARENERRAVG